MEFDVQVTHDGSRQSLRNTLFWTEGKKCEVEKQTCEFQAWSNLCLHQYNGEEDEILARGGERADAQQDSGDCW